MRAHDVFLSHSVKDKAVADVVCRGLEDAGIRCWIASRDILPAQTWAGAIVGAINSSRLMVLIFSGDANSSPQVLREVERAVSKRLPVIPFRIEDVVPSDDMAYVLTAPHWLDALTRPVEPHVRRLVAAAAEILSNGARATAAPAAPPRTVNTASGRGGATVQLAQQTAPASQTTEPVIVVELAPSAPVARKPETPPPRSLELVADALRAEPHSFGFFQAVRLLEKMYPERLHVGALDDPAREIVRFKANPSLSFPASEIQQLALGDDPPTMVVNFMGLIGPQAVLPHPYTLLVADRLRARDPALADFLDIFQHRMVSLFYQAWRKQRIAIAREDAVDDPLGAHLADAIGLGLSTVRNRLPFPDEALIYRAGLLAGMPRGAVALQQLIEDLFDVPAEVEQFVGSWYTLDGDDLCALGEDDALTNQLGLGAVAGDEIWDQQSRVRIRIGPIERASYENFLPGRPAHRSLASLVRFFSHDQFDFELQLVLARDDVAGIRLGDAGADYQLGWSTWICSAPRVEDADETILTLRTGAAL